MNTPASEDSRDGYAQTSSVQTMKSWAWRPETPSELPSSFQRALEIESGLPQQAIFFPKDLVNSTQMGRGGARLAGFFEDHLVVWEDFPKGVQKTSIPFGQIRWIQRGVVLLTSWLDVVGSVASVRLSFGSVSEDLMDPFLKHLRQATSAEAHHFDQFEAGRASLDYLAELHFKFMSYGRRLLRPGDAVQAVAYQAERRAGWHKMTTPQLVVLTEREILMIRDPDRLRRSRQSSYGGVFTFFPRRRVSSLIWSPRTGRNSGVLEVHVDDGPPVTIEGDIHNAQLAALVEAFTTSGGR